MGVQMRMYAVHSEYEVVVLEESSAQHVALLQRRAAAAKRGLGGPPPGNLEKILVMWHLELFELIKKKVIIRNVW